jgi:Fe/S biogenesis protein NfuA
VIQLTEQARDQILGFLREAEEPLALRIGVRAPSPVAPQYDLCLVPASQREPGDVAHDGGGFEVLVDGGSAALLAGARIDWVEGRQGSGFTFDNPNFWRPGSEPVTGPLADRVRQLLDERVNPGVAAHDGRITLVDLRDGVAYLRMGGGCQGCGMSAVTLRLGVEQLLREQIPELTGVVDVTDHAAGTNPYY